MAGKDDDNVPESRLDRITMQDVLDGLEELAAEAALRPWPGDFEILSIDAAAERFDGGDRSGRPTLH